MSLIDGLKKMAVDFECDNSIEPIVGMYIAVGRTPEGKLAHYVVGGKREDVEDPMRYFYRLGKGLARNSDDEGAQALIRGIINAMDEPLKEAMKGGEKGEVKGDEE